MRLGVGLIATFALALGVSAAPAGELKYLGKSATVGFGHILHDGRPYEVGPGWEIPGWGRVQEITDTTLVVDYQLSDADKERTRAAGGAPHDVKRALILRDDLHRIPVRAP